MIIELKYAQTFDGLEKACERAMSQIRERRYDERDRKSTRLNSSHTALSRMPSYA